MGDGIMTQPKDQDKLQIYFPNSIIKRLEEIGEDIGLKRTDVVKIAVKKYVDEYKTND